jgi:hypothetical protein
VKSPVDPPAVQDPDGWNDVAVYDPAAPPPSPPSLLPVVKVVVVAAKTIACLVAGSVTVAVTDCSPARFAAPRTGRCVMHRPSCGVVSAQAGSSTRRSRAPKLPPKAAANDR